jgi:hypothetical protein
VPRSPGVRGARATSARRAPRDALDALVATLPGRHHVYAVDITDKNAMVPPRAVRERLRRPTS